MAFEDRSEPDGFFQKNFKGIQELDGNSSFSEDARQETLTPLWSQFNESLCKVSSVIMLFAFWVQACILNFPDLLSIIFQYVITNRQYSHEVTLLLVVVYFLKYKKYSFCFFLSLLPTYLYLFSLFGSRRSCSFICLVDRSVCRRRLFCRVNVMQEHVGCTTQ